MHSSPSRTSPARRWRADLLDARLERPPPVISRRWNSPPPDFADEAALEGAGPDATRLIHLRGHLPTIARSDRDQARMANIAHLHLHGRVGIVATDDLCVLRVGRTPSRCNEKGRLSDRPPSPDEPRTGRRGLCRRPNTAKVPAPNSSIGGAGAPWCRSTCWWWCRRGRSNRSSDVVEVPVDDELAEVVEPEVDEHRGRTAARPEGRGALLERRRRRRAAGRTADEVRAELRARRTRAAIRGRTAARSARTWTSCRRSVTSASCRTLLVEPEPEPLLEPEEPEEPTNCWTTTNHWSNRCWWTSAAAEVEPLLVDVEEPTRSRSTTCR